MRSIRDSDKELMAVLYLQVSIVSQALIFVTRSRSWSYVECPGLFLLGAFTAAQLVTIISSCVSLFICRPRQISYRVFKQTNSRKKLNEVKTENKKQYVVRTFKSCDLIYITIRNEMLLVWNKYLVSVLLCRNGEVQISKHFQNFTNNWRILFMTRIISWCSTY